MSRGLILAAIATVALLGPWQLGDANAQTAAGQLSGSFQAGSGLALVVWSGGSLEQLRAAASGRGCVVESVWSSIPGGRFVGFLVGAPAPVNAAFNAAYPGGVFSAQVPLVLACGAGAGSPPAPLPSPPSETARRMTSISGNAFETPLEVRAGTTLVWTNLDGVSHSVAADDLSADSPFLRTGDSFEWRFAVPGRFTYYCRLHQQMTGTVIIQ